MSKYTLFLFFAIITIIAILGCSKQEAMPYKYVILVGEATVPDYKSLAVGSHFEEDSNLQVYSQVKFGCVEVYWDGEHEATFDSGGLVLSRNFGNLNLRGEINKNLKLLLLKKLEEGGWRLLEKKILHAGPIKYDVYLKN